MKIAVIGGGAAGLTSAWLLQAEHDVVVFESSDRPGGHARTMVVEEGEREVFVELGAQFFFESGYSGLCALIHRLGLPLIRERVGASMNLVDGRTLVVPPVRAAALSSIASPRSVRDLFWLGRFLSAGEQVVRDGDWSVSVERLIERVGVPRETADVLIVPFIAASWGVTREHALEMSAYSVRRVMGLDSNRLPHSLRLPRGLSSYIDRLVDDSPRSELRVNAPVRAVDYNNGSVQVVSGRGCESFDAVILGCDWHNSANMCASAPHLGNWVTAFRAFDDYAVSIAVHRDHSLMPARRAHWETNNYSLSRDMKPRNTMWPGKPVNASVFRSWLRPNEPEPERTERMLQYRHVAMTTEHPKKQAALARLQGQCGVYAVGMYTTGIDNHESALRSALKVAQKIAPNSERVRWFESRVSA